MKRTLTMLCVVTLFLMGVLLGPDRVSGSRMPAAPQQGRKLDRDKPNPPVPGTQMEGVAGIKLSYIPAGKFQMGSKSGESDERPVHQVVISAPFYMGKYEVTQAQWESVIGTNPSHFRNCPTCPVENVNWDDCQAFIRKLNAQGDGNTYALPTEAQWEYACRAGTTTPFSFGATITPEQVNYNGNFPFGSAARGVYREKTIPVGSLKSPNMWGLHDMHGNVAEWCADWFSKDSYRDSPTIDPKGPSSGELHVLRGGTWINDAGCSRSADRSGGSPEARNFNVGFRVVVHSARK